jgi:hypothetical protein
VIVTLHTFVPPHEPLWQLSEGVQALPSLQKDPSLFAGFEQMPVPGAHVPTTWHWSCAVHTTGAEPVHTPV